ncbi:alpha/beta hydrolase [Peribacillus butanolivorans]|uniref:alpha/beta fold hydrolase n=1 Tax=Peribacillus butanolivorans TaxID=421767 RepID=UPI00207D062C|nr:alpha/beta hydrolase [Peribacillus butanolivorans]MCO0599982.1 alpha/beta hydrolase [Peribacillus butanolivorans]
MQKEFVRSIFSFNVENVDLDVSAIHRGGELSPIVFLHGFGSTKEDYTDIVRYTAFAGHPFLAYDAPGFGETHCSDLSQLSIPFLVETALAVLECVKFERFHLVGHSMGGLTALMLAHKYPDRVLSFVNIEGNIAPEDCFLSRQIIDYPQDDAKQFFDDFIERTRHAPAYSSALYAASLRYKVRAGAVRGIFQSMVDLSDNGDLMNKFLNLPYPKMFMYGEQNASLSYLSNIQAQGVRLAEIPDCGHFPMYSNPPLMWKEIADFQASAEAEATKKGMRFDDNLYHV